MHFPPVFVHLRPRMSREAGWAWPGPPLSLSLSGLSGPSCVPSIGLSGASSPIIRATQSRCRGWQRWWSQWCISSLPENNIFLNSIFAAGCIINDDKKRAINSGLKASWSKLRCYGWLTLQNRMTPLLQNSSSEFTKVKKYKTDGIVSVKVDSSIMCWRNICIKKWSWGSRRTGTTTPGALGAPPPSRVTSQSVRQINKYK